MLCKVHTYKSFEIQSLIGLSLDELGSLPQPTAEDHSQRGQLHVLLANLCLFKKVSLIT